MNIQLSLLLTLVLSVPSFAEQSSHSEFLPGVHYDVLPKSQLTDELSDVDVLEVFQYHCPHCYRLTLLLQDWRKNRGRDIRYGYLSVGLGKLNMMRARAYYAAVALNVIDDAHGRLFDAIHRDKNKLDSEEAITEIFLQAGIEKGRFLQTFRSSKVSEQLANAMHWARKYKITGTPAIIVKNKYLVSSRLAGGYRNMIRIVDHLLAKESISRQ